jgi:hypothetical protein
MDKEQRRRTRIPIQLSVSVQVHYERIPVTTKNLSLKGLLCSPDPRLAIGTNCRVTLRLAPDVHVSVHGTVVRSSRQEIAIDFIDMDEDSFAHLKKIIEYNSQDADQIDEELLRPAFLPPSTDEH